MHRIPATVLPHLRNTMAVGKGAPEAGQGTGGAQEAGRRAGFVDQITTMLIGGGAPETDHPRAVQGEETTGTRRSACVDQAAGSRTAKTSISPRDRQAGDETESLIASEMPLRQKVRAQTFH